MAALPPSSEFTTVPGNHANMRATLDNQRAFLAGLFGTDGTVATALATLGALGSAYVAKTAAYTVVLADRGKLINATSGTWTLTLPAAASAGSGFSLFLRNSGAGVITVDPNGAELIDGAATLAVAASSAILLTCTGTAWISIALASAGGGGGSTTLTGHVTGSGTGTVATTITDGVVTLAKQADIATGSIMGRVTAATGVQEVLTPAQVKTLLAIATADVSGLGALATLSTLDLTYLPTAGIKQIVRFAATGNVNLATNGLTAVDGIALVAGDRIFCPFQTTASENWIYEASASAWARAPDSDTSTKIYGSIVTVLRGATYGGTQWATSFKSPNTLGTDPINCHRIMRDDMVTLAAQEPASTGDVTNTAGSLARTIAANAVTNAKLATMAANTVKANATAGAAVPTDIALAASQLFGRGATGDIAPVILGTNLSMTGTTLNAAGGSGSPGGSTTQMQFNNAGAFAGASDVLVEGSQLRLPTASGTTQPASGGTKLIGMTKAGRTVPAFLTQDGLVRGVQSDLARGFPLLWKAMPNNVALSTIGCGTPTAVGTATAANIATTNLVTYTPRLEYLVTAAATTAIAGFRGLATMVTVGGGAAGVGGFHFHGVWGPATGVATTTTRAFFGLANITSAPTDVEPSTSVNCIAMGWDAADTNIQIMFNDAAGACTKTDLGASFPVPTTDRTALYSLEMFSPKGTTQSVEWLVTDMVSGATASGTISTNLPATSSLLAPRGWISVGGTSSVIGFGLASVGLDPLL